MTDRQTDRQTDSLPYAYRLERLCGLGKFAKTNGGGTTTSTANSEESVSIRVREDQRNWKIWQGIKQAKMSQIGGAHHTEDFVTLPESSLLTTLLSQNYGNTINNFRVQRMMGILPTKGMATMESIPDKKDKSMFSCVRYQFFLDAPFEISNYCCNVMKKAPGAAYKRKTHRLPITGQMASESRLRTQIWLKQGCNAFDAKKPMSNPMAFWTEQDVLLYIYKNKIPIASVYGDVVKENGLDGQMDWEDYGLFELERPLLKTTGCDRTGCMFCGFGCHLEKPGNGRFERMKETHPKQYDYIMRSWDKGGLGYKEVIDWINEHGNLNIRY